MLRFAALVFCLLIARAASADDRHLVYVELLGKGGAYGVGYEYSLLPRLSFGGAASFTALDGQHLTTVAPYVHATLFGKASHRAYTELGAIVAHSHIASPVSDWKGMTNTGTGGFLSLGYEHARKRLVFRAAGSVVAGDGGVGPMVGISIGARP